MITQRSVRGQPSRFGPPGAHETAVLALTGPIPLAVLLVRADLPHHSGRMTTQPATDRAQRLTRRPPHRDLFPLRRTQTRSHKPNSLAPNRRRLRRRCDTREWGRTRYGPAPPASRVATRSLTRRTCGAPLTPEPLRPLRAGTRARQQPAPTSARPHQPQAREQADKATPNRT